MAVAKKGATKKATKKVAKKAPAKRLNNKIYKNNFLKQVIFRVDFEETNLDLGKYLKPLLQEFPNGGMKVLNGQSFTISNNGTPQITSIQNFEWNYSNAQKEKILNIGINYLSITYNKYEDNKKLLSDIGLVDVFLKDCGIKTIPRVGLRYINEFDIEKNNMTKLADFLDASLMTGENFSKKINKNPLKSLSQFTYREDEYVTVFTFGLVNYNYPSPIFDKIFRLDYDCSTILPCSIEEVKMVDLAKEFNLTIGDFFEKSIKDTFRNKIR